MLYLGTLAAIVTVMTGLGAQKSIPPGDAQRVVGIHEALDARCDEPGARSLHFRLDDAQELHRAVAQGDAARPRILGILLTIGADRGAELVYGYGAAVNWSTAQQQK